jgi:hypothetical protein
VFTAVPVLRNAFTKMGLNPVLLSDAAKSRLPLEDQAEWGSYYAQKPQVMVIRRIERRSHSRVSGTEAGEPATGVCCQTCGMMLKKK